MEVGCYLMGKVLSALERLVLKLHFCGGYDFPYKLTLRDSLPNINFLPPHWNSSVSACCKASSICI